jgi:tryptophanyl-tRNA synthetase
MKKYTIDKITEFLLKHQERRKDAKKRVNDFMLKL